MGMPGPGGEWEVAQLLPPPTSCTPTPDTTLYLTIYAPDKWVDALKGAPSAATNVSWGAILSRRRPSLYQLEAMAVALFGQARNAACESPRP